MINCHYFPGTNICYHWLSSLRDNDFALVKLQKRSTVTPVTMDSDNLSGSYDSDKSLWPIGFGNQNPNGNEYPDRLHHVDINYVPQSTCNSNYNGGITENMICAVGKYLLMMNKKKNQ